MRTVVLRFIVRATKDFSHLLCSSPLHSPSFAPAYTPCEHSSKKKVFLKRRVQWCRKRKFYGPLATLFCGYLQLGTLEGGGNDLTWEPKWRPSPGGRPEIILGNCCIVGLPALFPFTPCVLHAGITLSPIILLRLTVYCFFSSVTQLYLTLYDPGTAGCQASLALTIPWSLPRFMHWIGDAAY